MSAPLALRAWARRTTTRRQRVMNGKVIAERTIASVVTASPSSTSRPSARSDGSANSVSWTSVSASSSSCSSGPCSSASGGGWPRSAAFRNAPYSTPRSPGSEPRDGQADDGPADVDGGGPQGGLLSGDRLRDRVLHAEVGLLPDVALLEQHRVLAQVAHPQGQGHQQPVLAHVGVLVEGDRADGVAGDHTVQHGVGLTEAHDLQAAVGREGL